MGLFGVGYSRLTKPFSTDDLTLWWTTFERPIDAELQ